MSLTIRLDGRFAVAFKHDLEVAAEVRVAELAPGVWQMLIGLPSIPVEDAGEVPPASRAAAAWTRGPKAPFGDPGGIFPCVKPPHLGHHFFHRRKSRTKALKSGISPICRTSALM
jgi:hypothetical protein